MHYRILLTLTATLYLFITASSGAKAQPEISDVLRQVGRVSKSPKIAYDYKVTLYSIKQAKDIDMITGRLYKNGNNYLDSSNASLTLVSGKYCFKLNRRQKQAIVYDLDLLERKLGLKRSADNGLFVIPDSDIIRYGKIYSGGPSNDLYVIKMQPKDKLFSDITVNVRKSDYQVESFEFETSEPQNAKPEFKRRYIINNIRWNVDDTKFNTDRFFKLDRKKAILNKDYADYKVKTIIS